MLDGLALAIVGKKWSRMRLNLETAIGAQNTTSQAAEAQGVKECRTSAIHAEATIAVAAMAAVSARRIVFRAKRKSIRLLERIGVRLSVHPPSGPTASAIPSTGVSSGSEHRGAKFALPIPQRTMRKGGTD